jgi:hypothetical protein
VACSKHGWHERCTTVLVRNVELLGVDESAILYHVTSHVSKFAKCSSWDGFQASYLSVKRTLSATGFLEDVLSCKGVRGRNGKVRAVRRGVAAVLSKVNIPA